MTSHWDNRGKIGQQNGLLPALREMGQPWKVKKI